MRLSGYRRTTQIDDCFVFDSVAEIQPGETVPLLKNSLRQNFEMAPVHMADSHVPSSETLRVNSGASSSALEMKTKSCYFQTFNRGGLCFVIIQLRMSFYFFILYWPAVCWIFWSHQKLCFVASMCHWFTWKNWLSSVLTLVLTLAVSLKVPPTHRLTGRTTGQPGRWCVR